MVGRPEGFATPQAVIAVAFSLVFFVFLTNLLVVQYGQGVVRGALDEAVRAASPAGASIADCERAFDGMLAGLLGGPMGEGVSRRCSIAAGTVEASATAVFPGWLPGIPAFRFDLAATAVREGGP